jgi:hypothetical protein
MKAMQGSKQPSAVSPSTGQHQCWTARYIWLACVHTLLHHECMKHRQTCAASDMSLDQPQRLKCCHSCCESTAHMSADLMA